MKAVPMIAALMLAGCATYAPLPLDRDPGGHVPPDLAALSREAATIERPYLHPVAIDLAQPLDGNAVAILAVIASPELRAARARAGVSEAQAFAARLLPDPTLSLGVSPVLAGPDPLLDLVAALGVDFAALRSRSVRVAQAAAAARQVRLDLAWSEWQAAGQARIQVARILGQTKAQALTAQTLASARSLYDRTSRAAGRGDLAGDQVQAARIALADAQAKARTASRDLATARFELTRLLGLPPAASLRLIDRGEPDRTLDAEALFAQATRNRTDLRALEQGYAAQEAAVRKAVLDQFPTLALTLTGNRDTSGNAIVGPAIDFTLPLWNRNRGGIAVERATRAALKTEYEARLFQTRAEIAAAVGGVDIARRQRDAARRDLPAIERFAVATRRAATRGDLSLATAETAEQALRDRRTLLVQAEQDVAEQMIALELLTGTLREAWTS